MPEYCLPTSFINLNHYYNLYPRCYSCIGLTQKCMKSVCWGYCVCLRMWGSNMTSSSWMIDERTDACVLAGCILFPSKHVKRHSGKLRREEMWHRIQNKPCLKVERATTPNPDSKINQFTDRGLPHIWARGLTSCHPVCHQQDNTKWRQSQGVPTIHISSVRQSDWALCQLTKNPKSYHKWLFAPAPKTRWLLL